MSRPLALRAPLLQLLFPPHTPTPPLSRLLHAPISRPLSTAAAPRKDADTQHAAHRRPTRHNRPPVPTPQPLTTSPSSNPPPRPSTSAPLFVLPSSLTPRQRAVYLTHLRRVQRCLSQRLLAPALSAFAALTRAELPPCAAAYELLLEACALASDTERAVAVLQRMLDSGWTPSPVAYHRVVRTLCHSGRVGEAWAVVAQGLRPLVSTSAPSLLPLLPVVPLLLERSRTPACEGRFAGEVGALQALLENRRQALTRLMATAASTSSSMASEQRRELVFVSLALMDCIPTPSTASRVEASVAEVSALYRPLRAIRPPLSSRQTAEVYRAVITAYARLSAFDEAVEVCERWVELLKATPHSPPSQQQSFRLACQTLLLLSRADYFTQLTSTAAPGRSALRVQMERLLALLSASRLPVDDRTLLVALCAALPAGDVRHLPLLAQLRLQLQLPSITAPPDVEEDEAAVRQHRGELARWVMGALSQRSIHPSDELLSLLASSLDLSASTESNLKAALSAIPALRSQFHVQPSYALLHSLLPDARAKVARERSLPAIHPLLRHFAESYSLPPSPHTLHLIHRVYQPTAPSDRRSREAEETKEEALPPPTPSSPRPVVGLPGPLSVLLDLSRSYGQSLSSSTVLSLLRSAVAMGGSAASRVASRTRREWEALESLEATRLALRCWMEGGEGGQRAALLWWMGRAQMEERSEREEAGHRMALLALDDGVVDAMVSGLRQAGEEAGATDVVQRWTQWRQSTGGQEAAARTGEGQAVDEEELLDAL